MVFQSKNPYNGDILAEHDLMNDAEIAIRLKKAEKAYTKWHKVPIATRCELIKKVADILRHRKDELARLMTLEMGKLSDEAIGEVLKSAGSCDYFAENGKKFLKEKIIATDATKSYVRFDPIGAVFAIMPWNFPFWQVLRYAAPTLIAGNVTLLKHAPNVTGCALAIEKIFLEAGFPEGVFQVLIMDVDKTESVIATDIVQGITLTGSERAGESVGALAGKHLKKSVLELGGSDPIIIFPDADMAKAAAAGVRSRMINAGQACNGSKRFILLEDAKDAFLTEMITLFKTLKTGNPLEHTTTLAPLARLDLAEQIQRQFQQSIQKGAVKLAGGECDGCVVEPMLLDMVKTNMPAFEEETFGPLIAITTVKNEKEALKLANLTRYGLAAAIWTQDLAKAQRMAKYIDAGNVFINDLVRSDPRLPFGGIKKSGYGRELAEIGLKEFVNVKTVFVK